ncbi:MAG: PipA/GogA/GtgA family type III secretion system effector [Candidatus Arsenophonus phytopathogenicus]
MSNSSFPYYFFRLFICLKYYEIVHALTMLTDDENSQHIRGPIVEYTNIILKEMGDNKLIRFSYQWLISAGELVFFPFVI